MEKGNEIFYGNIIFKPNYSLNLLLFTSRPNTNSALNSRDGKFHFELIDAHTDEKPFSSRHFSVLTHSKFGGTLIIRYQTECHDKKQNFHISKWNRDASSDTETSKFCGFFLNIISIILYCYSLNFKREFT